MSPDSRFKNSIVAWHRLVVSLRNALRVLRWEFGDWISGLLPGRRVLHSGIESAGDISRLQSHSHVGGKPLIFVSYATDESLKGSHLYCGGEKLLNNLVLLLRRKGYEAWMVSTDGTNAGWLAEHAPFLSIAEFIKKKAGASDVRCVTSWMKAMPFIEQCPKFYFWDQELSASSRSHFPELAAFMADNRIIRTAGVNRTVQAWHRCVFETPAAAVRQLIDDTYWKPDSARRIPNRVGYFDEGDYGAEFVRRIAELTKGAGLALEFVQLEGVEKEIISQMQQCGTFLVLNVGKSPLWGEGGPMSPQEAMACGAVPVCLDINGPWELIQQHYNGIITREFTPEAMANELIWLYGTPGRHEVMVTRALEISRSSHSMEARWSEVARFLDLPEASE